MNKELNLIENNEDTIIVKDENGVTHTCSKLFTFSSEETNLDYICYTENEKDENGNVLVYAGTYDATGESDKILPLQSEREWNIIKDTLGEIVKAVGDEDEK